MLARLVLLSAVIVTGQELRRPWVPRFLEGYPLAICNDGSPGAYYHRVGLPGARRWVIFLDGVGWCWDNESCENTWKRGHSTSLGFPRTVEGLAPNAHKFLNAGLFDQVRSPLKDAHIALVKSCSNDGFMGDRSPANPELLPPFAQRKAETGWHFRGRRIVEAVFRDLRKHTGLGLQLGDRVVYAGCSAGARGVIATIDYVAGSEAIVGKAGVVGLIDSGLWVPISPKTNDPAWDSFGHQTREAMVMMNASALIGGRCEETYPGAERWKCLMAAYSMPFIRTPYFLVHSQYDQFAIGMNIWGRWGHAIGPENYDFAENYRTLVLRYLPNPANGSGIVVYSPACYYHCVLTKDQFWLTRASGVPLIKALQQWLESPDTAGSKIIETCKGFNCGEEWLSRPSRSLSVGRPGPVDKPKVNGQPLLLT